MSETETGPRYELVDHTTSKERGWLTLLYGSQRICDFFPFSPQAPEAFVREQAQIIVETMNRVADAESFQCPSCHWHQGHDPAEWFVEEVQLRAATPAGKGP